MCVCLGVGLCEVSGIAGSEDGYVRLDERLSCQVAEP